MRTALCGVQRNLGMVERRCARLQGTRSTDAARGQAAGGRAP